MSRCSPESLEARVFFCPLSRNDVAVARRLSTFSAGSPPATRESSSSELSPAFAAGLVGAAMEDIDELRLRAEVRGLAKGAPVSSSRSAAPLEGNDRFFDPECECPSLA